MAGATKGSPSFSTRILLLLLALILLSIYGAVGSLRGIFSVSVSLFDATIPPSMDYPRVHKLEDLRKRPTLHGIFYYGLNSQQLHIPKEAIYEPTWNTMQKYLLDDDDEAIDVDKEKERCARYNFDYDNRMIRRRLFWGALLADDSYEVLRAVGTEIYNVFHTISFVESNSTHALTRRKWRFYDPERPSSNLYRLYQYFGPKTKVSVDYYVSSLETSSGDSLLMDFLQREGNSYRWAFNGMRHDDVAVVGDADETFSRDFLRALQICDIPRFRPNQNCKEPKMIASTIVFESSPNCVTKDRRWHHPDAVIGECLDQIGNATLHPPTKRNWNDKHGERVKGYGADGDYSRYEEDVLGSIKGQYPLWFATDVRMEVGGDMYEKNDGSPTGYHFHNFFNNAEEMRKKYHTYGHAKDDAMGKPVWELDEDTAVGTACARGVGEYSLHFSNLESTNFPIYYLNEETRDGRHKLWQSIVKEDEDWWNQTQKGK